MSDLSEEEIERVKKELEELNGFRAIKPTKLFMKFLQRHEKIIAFFTGNQWGKNVNIVKHYIIRWMGVHPVERKNLRPGDKIRTYRFCAETLPNDPDNDAANANTIYPVLKQMIPSRMIRKDITQRNSTMTLIDIYQGGPDFYVEFVSYDQKLQKQAGKQRKSVYIDENCSRAFVEEQQPRLLAADGDIVIGMTPAIGSITWQFEDIYENAGTIIRTPRVVKRLKERFNEVVEEEQKNPNGDQDICVIMASTDDNPHYDFLVEQKNKSEIELINLGKHPFYKKIADYKPVTKASYIKSNLGLYDDETEDVRRYGIFRQVSGRIFKDFDNCHIINGDKYFPDGIPHAWLHARGIDYHKHVDWHCGWIALSPDDEAFIYEELVISPEKFVTLEIARQIAERSKDYKYGLNLIDPLSGEMQVNTGKSSLEDLNRIFGEFRRDGIGTGGYWSPWDTKSARGREEIRKRLKNAKLCGTPFNNSKGGVKLPTLWVLSKCRVSIDYMKNWRLEEWTDRAKLETKEIKESPMQRYSHMNMVWEAVMKESAFRPTRSYDSKPRHTVAQYGRR